MKTETKHTPGPWAIGAETNLEQAQIISGEGWHLALVQLSPVIANARLIAAAPDLLAACKGLMAACVGLQAAYVGSNGYKYPYRSDAAEDAARAAIAAATGEG